MKLSKKEAYNMLFTDYPDVLEIKHVCEILDICPKTAYKKLKDNEIKHIRIGRKYIIPKINLMEHLEVI